MIVSRNLFHSSCALALEIISPPSILLNKDVKCDMVKSLLRFFRQGKFKC